MESSDLSVAVYRGPHMPMKGIPVAVVASYSESGSRRGFQNLYYEYFAFFTGDRDTFLSDRAHGTVRHIPGDIREDKIGVEVSFDQSAMFDLGHQSVAAAVNAHLDNFYDGLESSHASARPTLEFEEMRLRYLMDLYLRNRAHGHLWNIGDETEITNLEWFLEALEHHGRTLTQRDMQE